ncbi:MAG: deoxyribodipyrimidine photo-lyase [Candidatus Dormibacteraceae bacterium]
MRDPAFASAAASRRTELDRALTALSPRLRVLAGDPATELAALARASGATECHASRDVTSFARRRGEVVEAALAAVGCRLHWHDGLFTHPLAISAPRPVATFSAFYRRWASLPLPPPPPGTPLPPRRYDELHDLPGVDGTSRLSAALHLGTIAPRAIAASARGEFHRQLAWRDYFAAVARDHPDLGWRSILGGWYDRIPVDEDRRLVERWQEGRTGFPMVDAGMRELVATGWMHNRARLITASFLVHDLHLPWQWGAGHFMATLIDGDIASNAGNWQWVAGAGPTRRPLRPLSPTVQAHRFDADGAYQRRWVPEAFSGRDYPSPCVDHAREMADAQRRRRSVR